MDAKEKTFAIAYERVISGMIDGRFEISIGIALADHLSIQIIDNYDRTMIFKQFVKFEKNKTRQIVSEKQLTTDRR